MPTHVPDLGKYMRIAEEFVRRPVEVRQPVGAARGDDGLRA
jgi:hypothetical protein